MSNVETRPRCLPFTEYPPVRPAIRPASDIHAERLVREELLRRGWEEVDLVWRREGDPGKLGIAWCLGKDLGSHLNN
jgi:hypothetical protein